MENSDDAAVCSSGMNSDERFASMRSIGDVCFDEDELRLLLDKTDAPTCYVWCHPSPWVHIAQGIRMAININKMVKAGCRVKILMADWLVHMKKELGDDLNKIRTVGCYMIETWKAAGMEVDRVEFIWLSDEINRHLDEFWPLAMDIAIKNSPKRLAMCYGIMDPYLFFGEIVDPCVMDDEIIDPYCPEEWSVESLFSPCLQCAAVLLQQADIWLLTMVHQEVSKLTREYCKDIKRENKPIILSYDKLPNLLENPGFRNHGDPSWAIFMEDTSTDIGIKIVRTAFCPAQVIEGNPCLEYINRIIFPWLGKFVVVRRNKTIVRTYENMEELITEYKSGVLHPADVKLALAIALDDMLEDIRHNFNRSTEAKDLRRALLEFYVLR